MILLDRALIFGCMCMQASPFDPHMPSPARRCYGPLLGNTFEILNIAQEIRNSSVALFGNSFLRSVSIQENVFLKY